MNITREAREYLQKRPADRPYRLIVSGRCGCGNWHLDLVEEEPGAKDRLLPGEGRVYVAPEAAAVLAEHPLAVDEHEDGDAHLIARVPGG